MTLSDLGEGTVAGGVSDAGWHDQGELGVKARARSTLPHIILGHPPTLPGTPRAVGPARPPAACSRVKELLPEGISTRFFPAASATENSTRISLIADSLE
jgi:hypothetical protein